MITIPRTDPSVGTHPDGSYVIPAEGAIGPEGPVWKYEAPDKVGFHSSFVSSSQRLANSNTFICEGDKGRFFEVTPGGEIVWEFWDPFASDDNPVDFAPYGVFRATKIDPDHAALQGRELKPIEPQPITAAERKARLKAVLAEPRGLTIDSDASSGISGGFFIERDRDLARRGETGRLS